jgi:hypothetical protein
MRLTFSSEIHVFPGDFTCNRLPVVLILLSQNRMLFHVEGRRRYCILKRRRTAIRVFNSSSHSTHWACSCGVDIVTELAESHQLAQVRKLGMKKASRVFLSDDINRIRVWKLVFEIYIFYFGYLSSGHPVSTKSKTVHQWYYFHSQVQFPLLLFKNVTRTFRFQTE